VRVALGAGVAAVLLLGLSQAVLPRLAVQRVRDQMKPYGTLQNVSVSAWPAIELLWGKADRASASAQHLAMSEAQAMSLAWEGRGIDEANMRVGTLELGVPGLPRAVALSDVVSRKRGDRVSSEATLTQADLEAATPSGVQVQPLASAPGTLKVQASGSLFGVPATVVALLVAREGKLVAEPLNIPFGQFVQLTLFSYPHVYLDGISASPSSAGGEGSWRLQMSGSLR
jgi:hypothetical protein